MTTREEALTAAAQVLVEAARRIYLEELDADTAVQPGDACVLRGCLNGCAIPCSCMLTRGEAAYFLGIEVASIHALMAFADLPAQSKGRRLEIASLRQWRASCAPGALFDAGS